MTHLNGQTVLQYRIVEKLGEGGMGVVYKAEDTKLHRTVALKFLPHDIESHESERARFLQEAQAAALLNHPNICTIHDMQEHEGEQFIVMEYVDGKTLRQLVPIEKMQTAIDYAEQIGEALQEAHSKGIVHRDIKTDNIMVNSKNQIKVMDFGLAKLRGSRRLTKSRSTVGTLAYMAPEQIQGGEVDARSDIFSFGVVLFEMLTGQLPFKGEHEAGMMYSILNERPQDVNEFRPHSPPELVHVLARALDKNPGARYQSIHNAILELRQIRAGSLPVKEGPLYGRGDQHRNLGDSRRESGTGRRRGILQVIGGASLILAVFLVYLLVSSQRSPRINPNRSVHVLPIPTPDITSASLSPDGHWIAFPGWSPGSNWHVHFMNAFSGEVRQLSSDSLFLIWSADISPEGSQVVFSGRREPSHESPAVYTVSSAGGVNKKLVDDGECPKWRPDGLRIGYIRVGSPHGSVLSLWSIKPDGTDERLEYADSSGIEGQISFSWSPDGRSIAWLRTMAGKYQELFTRGLLDGLERQLTFDKKKITDVCWTHQNEIVFSSNRKGNTNLWIVPSEGGDPIELTTGVGPDEGASVSWDGKRMLYTQVQEISHIWLADITGSNTRQLTFDDRRAANPSLSPDGKHIVFELKTINPVHSYASSICIVDRDGTNRRDITAGQGIASTPVFSPDGKWISFFAGTDVEPIDSMKLYLVETTNVAPPREIQGIRYGATDGFVHWLTPESFLVCQGTISLIMDVRGGERKQFYEDSAWARPILDNKYVLFRDLHTGRDGEYVVAYNYQGGNKVGKPIRLDVPSDPTFYLEAPYGGFLIYGKNNEEWKITLPDCRKEKLNSPFPSLHYWAGQSISYDEREIVYTDSHLSGKLMLIDEMH